VYLRLSPVPALPYLSHPLLKADKKDQPKQNKVVEINASKAASLTTDVGLICIKELT